MTSFSIRMHDAMSNKKVAGRTNSWYDRAVIPASGKPTPARVSSGGDAESVQKRTSVKMPARSDTFSHANVWAGRVAQAKRIAAALFLVPVLWCGRGLPASESAAASPSREKLQQLLQDPNPLLRSYAVYNIAYRFPDDAASLARFVSDASPHVRRAAIFSLGLFRFDAATKQFLQALRDPDYGVRRAAVFALGNIASGEAMQGVERALTDEDSMVRQLAVLAVARTRNKGSVPKLISRLGDESPRVRRAAACALGMLGDRSALDPLKRLYRNRRSSQPPKRMLAANEKVRQALTKKLNLNYEFLHFVETLDRLSQASGTEIRLDDEVLFQLNTSASDPDNLASIRVVMWKVPFEKALAKIAETVEAYYYIESGTINISSRTYRAYDTPVSLEVAGAMALLGENAALAEVRTFLGDPQFRTRAREIWRAVTGR